MTPLANAKLAAARAALDFVQPGMRLGLGTGSTAALFVDALGARVAQGLKVTGVPTSEATRAQAEKLGIPLTTLDETPELDLTIDGADEFDPALRLIKGGGAALLREKIVAAASAKMIVIADGSKQVAHLGRFPLPVEVNAFGLAATRRLVIRNALAAGCEGAVTLRLRAGGMPLVTDGGHHILDCAFGMIGAPDSLSDALFAVPGVVEHGLFLGLASVIIVADSAGVRLLHRHRAA